MIPTLTTDRLTLRAPSEADLPALTAYNASDRSRFTGGPADEFATWSALMMDIGHWQLRGYGFFSVDETATGAMVGRVGVIFYHGWPEPELAWHLFDGFEGKGYASEAARAARAWYAGARSAVPLISLVHPDNAPSAAVCRRIGATAEREVRLLGQPAVAWRHPAGDAR